MQSRPVFAIPEFRNLANLILGYLDWSRYFGEGSFTSFSVCCWLATNARH